MNLQQCYSRVTNPFGAGGEFYDPQSGHGGADYPSNSGDPVLAYQSGVIGYVGSSGWGGGVVGMQLDGGQFAGWAHLDPIAVKVGQRVKAGDIIGYTAGWNDNHGTSWTGPHIHTTRSAQSSIAAALGYRPLIDPAPGIAAAIKKTSNPTSPTPGEEEEDDDMKNCGFYYTRGSDKNVVYLIINFGSGAYHEYTQGKPNVNMPGSYNNPVAAALGTGSYASITEGHAKVMKAAADKVRQGK